MWRAKDENGQPRDWCSYFPDRVFKVNMSQTCKEHDMRYKDKSKSRWTADLEMFNKTKNQGAPILAAFMFIGVRTFGWLFYGK